MLTKTQLNFYKTLEAYKAEHGIMPSHREMAELMGIASTSATHSLVAQLEKRGALERIPRTHRAIRLLPLV